jgi:hypothetical protein
MVTSTSYRRLGLNKKQKKKKKNVNSNIAMNHWKVAVLFPDGENIYACDYYGDSLASTLLKRAREANS